MKKVALLALLVMLIPGVLNAQSFCSKEGDPGFFWGFWPTATVIAGETWCDTPAPTNFGFVSGTCTQDDTFCFHMWDDSSWVMYADTTGGYPELETCFVLGSGYWMPGMSFCIEVPCDAEIGEVNVVCLQMAFCDTGLVCAPDCGDCEDPNWYGDPPAPYYSITCCTLTVITPPPALYILQDSLTEVEEGQTAAYIPFEICNGNPCAPPTTYAYNIKSKGHVGPAIDQSSTAPNVPGGECQIVYGIIDAGSAIICDLDTLTIIAWSVEEPIVYDTCVQLIHVVEPVPVPLFSAPVVTILVLAMILAAAVFMKRRAVSRA
jgi:hypothetical protein